jgi:hypothetical protein
MPKADTAEIQAAKDAWAGMTATPAVPVTHPVYVMSPGAGENILIRSTARGKSGSVLLVHFVLKARTGLLPDFCACGT